MIKNSLLPEKIGAYYLFSKRIIGFDINRTHVTATRILLKGTQITIEQCIEEKLEAGIAEHQERVAQAIKTIIGNMPKYNEIRTALSSSLIVGKEPTRPWVSHEKIAMAVEFEVGPLLPFSVQDAIFDFIITHVNQEEGTARILVAATQKQHIAYHMQLFELAGISPDIITIDMFALYGLYKQVTPKADQGNIAFVDVGSQSTTITYIKQNQLYYIRSLPKGVSTIAKAVSKDLNLQPGQAIGNIMRFGIKNAEDPKHTQVMTQAIKQFWQDVQFKLQSVTSSDEPAQKEKIILLGMATDIEGLALFLKEELSVEGEIFDIQSFLQDSAIHIATKQPIKSTQVMSVSVALPSLETSFFTLRRKEFKLSGTSLLFKQLFVGSFLLVLLFGSLISFMIVQVHALKSEAINLEAETVAEIKERFTKIDEDEDRLDDVIEAAGKEVKQQESVLSAFLRSPSSSILNYLLELTKRLNPQLLGLQVEQITISQDKIIMKLTVRDYDALKMLEYDLAQSPLFKHISPQEDPSFTMEITLAKGKSDGNA